jgi:type IV secretion system protein VirB2
MANGTELSPDRRTGPGGPRSPSAWLASPFLFALAAAPVPAMAQARTADPAGSAPIVAALGWLEGTLLGNVATAVAVMAVAAVGFMMLTGRLNWRFGATVIIGCFILFGAGAIVSGIQAASGAG